MTGENTGRDNEFVTSVISQGYEANTDFVVSVGLTVRQDSIYFFFKYANGDNRGHGQTQGSTVVHHCLKS